MKKVCKECENDAADVVKLMCSECKEFVCIEDCLQAHDDSNHEEGENVSYLSPKDVKRWKALDKPKKNGEVGHTLYDTLSEAGQQAIAIEAANVVASGLDRAASKYLTETQRALLRGALATPAGHAAMTFFVGLLIDGGVKMAPIPDGTKDVVAGIARKMQMLGASQGMVLCADALMPVFTDLIKVIGSELKGKLPAGKRAEISEVFTGLQLTSGTQVKPGTQVKRKAKN